MRRLKLLFQNKKSLLRVIASIAVLIGAGLFISHSEEVNFEGILSSDCWSAYGPQRAMAKQKCVAHIERELKAMETSKLKANRVFAQQVFPILRALSVLSMPMMQ